MLLANFHFVKERAFVFISKTHSIFSCAEHKKSGEKHEQIVLSAAVKLFQNVFQPHL